MPAHTEACHVLYCYLTHSITPGFTSGSAYWKVAQFLSGERWEFTLWSLHLIYLPLNEISMQSGNGSWCLPDKELLITVHVKLNMNDVPSEWLFCCLCPILGTAQILCLSMIYVLSVHYSLSGFCSKDHDLEDRDNMSTHHEGNLMPLLWRTV